MSAPPNRPEVDGEAPWHHLDHAASSPLRPEAADVADHLGRTLWGNPSGAHALARRARDHLDEARERLASLTGCQPGELVFTSGGTEADNLAVRGTVAATPGRVVCTAIEHHAVLDPVLAAGGTVVPVDRRGVVDLDALAEALGDDVVLVSVGIVNNEVGTVQPLAEVRAVVDEHAPQARLHTDAAQALPWLDLRTATAPADLVTLASHKAGGPRGVGALVVRDGAPLVAQQVGGGQERGRRSGTPDVAAAAAFATAAAAADRDRDRLVADATRWRDRLLDTITAEVPGAVASSCPDGDRRHLVAGIANLCLPEVDSEALLYLLEHDHRVLASAASSCASGAQEPSHVLAALGHPRALAGGSLRLSLGWSTTEDDVAAALAGVPAVARRLQARARAGTPA
ncbi:MAG: cysteine desulfurase family protein [Acidimicrobiia bacterium]